MSTGIRIDSVEKLFGTNPVLKGINLEVANGELVSILGSSGCGKTTLLRIVAGLERASAGHVYFGEELQDQITVEKRAIAMVFQKALLFPNMTIGENVAFSLRAQKNAPVQGQFRSLVLLHRLRREAMMLFHASWTKKKELILRCVKC